MANKITRRFLDRKYDELYQRAKDLMKRTRVCGITKAYYMEDRLMHTTCNGIAKGCCSKDTRLDVLCCHAFGSEPTCQHISEQGCTVKSLRCTLWLCSGDLFPYSGIQNGVSNSMGPTEAHPNRNFRIGVAVFPFMDKEHAEIYKEAAKYRFLRFFRQGKTMAVNYAYATRDRIEDGESIALTPEEYNNIQHDATENCPCALCYEEKIINETILYWDRPREKRRNSRPN